jgi:excisionase family DNA binding protein
MSKRRHGTNATPADRAARVRPVGDIEIRINGIRVDVSPELEAAVQRAYQGAVPTPAAEMTTTQAATFLDVSRPFVIKLIQRGELPCRRVGKHRRIPSAALRAYREKMFQQARQAADKLARQSQELGLYDLARRSSKES